MLTVSITGDADMAAGLDGLPAATIAAIHAKSGALADRLLARVQQKLGGEAPRTRTGELAASVSVDGPALTDDAITSLTATARYAAIQEYGGVTSPHDILPQRAKALAFLAGGQQVFARHVHHPGSHIPERSYLRSSLAELAPVIAAEMKAAVLAAMQQQVAP